MQTASSGRRTGPVQAGVRVLLLSVEIDSSTFELSRLLERDCSVASVEISDDVRSLLGADIAIIDGRCVPSAFGSDVGSGGCARVAVLRQSNAEERLNLLEGGADLVLHGEVSGDEIVAQVRAIARRAGRLGRRKVAVRRRAGHIVLDADGRQAIVLGRRIDLTVVESRLLAVFLARPGAVLGAADLMKGVWGSSYGARSTVSAHVRRLRLKVEPDPSHPVFIRTVWGGGYVYRPAPDL